LGLAIEQWVNVEANVWAVTVALMAWPWLRSRPDYER
jgi:hypothetical protein